MTAQSNTPTQEIEELEYLNDLLTLQLARIETANDEMVPAAIVNRLAMGECPTRVWREHRGLDQETLARQANVTVGDLRAIESGETEGSVRQLAQIAGALRIDLDDLVPWPQEGDAPHA